ncbi:MAG: hypothetical protein MUC83_06990 [Pirellula sp.]|jgi:hypothetical protein|nr:hypothetical protein [Pirellula sp.]
MSQDAGVLEQLPTELHFLIGPALRFACRSEDDAFDHLDNLKQDDRELLAQIAAQVLEEDKFPRVMEFLKKYPLNEYDECAQLYFFFGLLDYGGFKFDRVIDP